MLMDEGEDRRDHADRTGLRGLGWTITTVGARIGVVVV